MHWPCAVVSRISSASEQASTPISASPSSSFIAILPLRLMLSKSAISLRRMSRRLGGKDHLQLAQLASSSGIGMMVVMRSPGQAAEIDQRLATRLRITTGRRQILSL